MDRVSDVCLKALTYYGPKDLKFENVEMPSARKDGIVIRVRFCAFCGSDIRRFYHAPPDLRLPLIMGHEFSGDIVEVGTEVKNLEVGMRVTCAPDSPCGRDYYCLEGHENMCMNLQSIGYNIEGAFAEYLLLPNDFLRFIRILPDDISYGSASQCEPLACALNGINVARVSVGDTIVILGAGPMGLMIAQLVKLVGARKVVVGEIMEHRIKNARDLADIVINLQNEDICKIVRDLTEGIGAGAVINTAVSQSTNDLALRLVKRTGVVNIFGGSASEMNVTVSPNMLHYSEINLTGSFGYTPKMYFQAFNLIASQRISVEKLISDKFPLDRALEAADFAAKRKGIKVALVS